MSAADKCEYNKHGSFWDSAPPTTHTPYLNKGFLKRKSSQAGKEEGFYFGLFLLLMLKSSKAL